MTIISLIALLLAALTYSSVSYEEMPIATFPLQFSATITITAHLINETTAYPPRTRKLSVDYDYHKKRSRADIQAGYEAAKIYIRNYDINEEYMIRLPPIDDCKRSYLGDIMPYPDIPDSKFVGVEIVRGITCDHFIVEEYGTRLHIYLASHTGSPVSLLQESVKGSNSIPLLTYDYDGVNLTPPSDDRFAIPNNFKREECDSHIGGWPYIHIFHHFARF